MHTFPIAQIIGRQRGQGFVSLGRCTSILSISPPEALKEPCLIQPRRKSLAAPIDNGTFVKPIRQAFIQNPRLSPMVRIMLTLLSGWSGQGSPLETTIGIIAKALGRCRRQVSRYLQEAQSEGYIYYSRTKDRMGLYTGIRIMLNVAAIRYTPRQKPGSTPKTAENQDVTYKSETNKKYILTKKDDSDLWEKLERLATLTGAKMPEPESS